MSTYIIATDFDGTICENAFPQIGEPRYNTINYLKEKQRNGAKVVLWTCRVKEQLDAAIKWCKDQGLIFDAINQNIPEIIEEFGGDTRKIFANEYIDDRNVWISEKEYDTQVCLAVRNNPYEFVDILHETAESSGNLSPMLHEAACVIANLLDSRNISEYKYKFEEEKGNG